MKQLKRSLLLFGLLCTHMVSVSAEPMRQDTEGDNLPSKELSSQASEYEKLLQYAKSQRRPVKSFNVRLDISGNPSMGSRNAEVVLIEFGDYQCPFCRRHLLNTAPKIRQEYVIADQLLYVFVDFPVEAKHPLAVKAAEAARCAGEQEKYWEMRNQLYSNQRALHEPFLAGHARSAGMDENRFLECLNSHRFSDEVLKDQQIGKSLRIRGTPTFFLGINEDGGSSVRVMKKITGAQSFDVFQREITRLIRLAQKTGTKSMQQPAHSHVQDEKQNVM